MNDAAQSCAAFLRNLLRVATVLRGEKMERLMRVISLPVFVANSRVYQLEFILRRPALLHVPAVRGAVVC